MSREDYLGEFEHLVLLAILQLGDEAYGVPIRELIEERAERPVSFGAVYSTLRRMERKGHVESWTGEAEPVAGGRAKKYFAVTPAGRRLLVQARARLESMSRGLELSPDQAG
jgi:PadR family transcriptional regulator PadR